MRCDFIHYQQKGHRYKHQCIRCGHITEWTPTQWNPFQVCRKKGWGDWTELVLRCLGVKRPCLGCQRRKDRLNNWDRRVYRLFKGPRDATYSETIHV